MKIGNAAEILVWDSDFFGFPIARITNPRMTNAQLQQVLSRLWAAEITLVYWGSDPEDKESTAAAEVNHGMLVDKKLLYSRHIGDFENNQIDSIVEYEPSPATDSKLEDIAIQCGHSSRFRVDPHFPKSARISLYREWSKNSINGTLADMVLVAVSESRIEGMVTLSITGKTGKTGTIGLIGVDSSARGKGIGKKLTYAALSWLTASKCQIAEVVTQHANITARRLYEACGFSLARSEDYYHFWNPETGHASAANLVEN